MPAGDRKQSTGAAASRRKGSNPSVAPGLKVGTKEEHTPVNNFNSQEVSNYFSRTWSATLDAYQQASTGAPGMGKPEMYKGSETMAWGNKSGPAWGKKGTTSTGADFLGELKTKASTLA
ncbi:hypothetical protein DFQ27_003608 [Actinomortierella ambigua]|uniref:Uncharacterized protein n=1 Tax=Actinomortierella ambigua TaxID=1343610 RepID=A0A9P6Q8K2_9FUNG|nr:hypothetical protein DFQ27_003608 [Actinomortierella ambigua]